MTYKFLLLNSALTSGLWDGHPARQHHSIAVHSLWHSWHWCARSAPAWPSCKNLTFIPSLHKTPSQVPSPHCCSQKSTELVLQHSTTPAAAQDRDTIVFLLLSVTVAALLIFLVGHLKLVPNLLSVVTLQCLSALLQLRPLPIECTYDGLLLSYTGSNTICIFQGWISFFSFPLLWTIWHHTCINLLLATPHSARSVQRRLLHHSSY